MLSKRSKDKLKSSSMKMKFIIAICILYCGYTKAQTLSPEVFASSCDYYISAGASLSWTLGEDLSETYVQSFAILTQGFQQPENEMVSVEEMEKDILINIFPNPTKDKVNIIINGIVFEKVNIDVFDIHGRLLIQKVFSTAEVYTDVDLNKYALGTFFIRITNEKDELLKSSIIIKI